MDSTKVYRLFPTSCLGVVSPSKMYKLATNSTQHDGTKKNSKLEKCTQLVVQVTCYLLNYHGTELKLSQQDPMHVSEFGFLPVFGPSHYTYSFHCVWDGV